MSGDAPVRFCERLGVGIPRATHPVLGFEHRADAERFLAEWKDRLRKFGLELHPDKTRLIEFGRHAAEHRKQRDEGKPEVFNFWGSPTSVGRPARPADSSSSARPSRNDSPPSSVN